MHFQPDFRPFHRYIVADSIRMVCIIGGIVFLAMLASMAFGMWKTVISTEDKADRYTLRFRLLLYPTTGAFAFATVFTEIGRLGHVPTWRLPVNTFGVVMGLVALSQLMTISKR